MTRPTAQTSPYQRLPRFCKLCAAPHRSRMVTISIFSSILLMFVLFPNLAFAHQGVPGVAHSHGPDIGLPYDSANLWQDADESEFVSAASVKTNIVASGQPTEYRRLTVNIERMDAILAAAPKTTYRASLQGAILTIPMPNGLFQRFAVEEYDMLEPSMATAYPNYKTYLGYGIDDRTATISLSRLPSGFHGMILTEHDTIYIDPQDSANQVISYSKSSLPAQIWQDDHDFSNIREAVEAAAVDAPVASGDKLHIYRIAIASTTEWTELVGGKDKAREAIAAFVNQLNGIYRRDLSVQFELVNNDKIIYTANDPYTNGNALTMLGENQVNLDKEIGDANYDIGHVFRSGGGGVASLNSLCTTGSKARGAGPPGIALHEIGHQISADHTFNARTASNCNSGNFSTNNVSNYEPGSGSTIMAYVGICGPQNLQSQRDNYLHAISIQEMQTHISRTVTAQCGRHIDTGNAVPAVDAGTDRSIPASTRFTLTGQGTDGDGDPLTFAWEQFDTTNEPWTEADVLPNTDKGNNPIFRSFPPVPENFRNFPTLKPELAAKSAKGESLPTTDRTMNFRLTVRDGKGGVNADDMKVTVVSTAGPFVITSPKAGELWTPGGQATVTWNVAQTDQAPFNCANVSITASTDGGKNFTTLAASTANNGTATVTAPNQLANLQLKIQCADTTNIFFALASNVLLCTPILQDNHEAGTDNWTVNNDGNASTVDWSLQTDGGSSGNNYWNAPSLNNVSFTNLESKELTAQGDELSLNLVHRYSFYDDGETIQTGTAQVKVNDGTWQDLKNFTGRQAQYTNSAISLKGIVKNNDKFQIRFRFGDSSGFRITQTNAEGWSIDDITVCGGGTGETAPPPPAPTAGQSTWTGADSTDWNAGGNWNTGQAPNATTDVQIPAGLTTYPAIAADATVRGIVIDSGAQVNMTGGTLSVHGDWGSQGGGVTGTGGGTVSAAALSATQNFCKDYTNEINPDPNIKNIGTTATTVTDTLTINSGGRLSDLDVLLEVNHTYVSDVKMKLRHNTSGTEIDLFDAGDFCQGDNFNLTLDDEATDTLAPACTDNNPAFAGNRYQPASALSAFDGKAFGGLWTLTITDNFEGDTGQLRKWCLNVTSEESAPTGGTGGSFNGTGGTVVFKGTTQSVRPAAGSTFNNVQIGDGTVASQVSLAGDIDINGNLVVSNGAKLSGGTATVKLAGNWTQPDSTSFNAENGAVIFDGTAQIVSGALAVNNMSVNATSTVDMGTNDLSATGKLINEGSLKQSKDVPLETEVRFLATGGYGGLTLYTIEQAMGQTTVTIRKSTTGCTATPGGTIQRCYSIEPAVTTGVGAFIDFYYDQAEQINHACTNMSAYPNDGSGGQLTALSSDFTSCDNPLRSLTVSGVNDFSVKDFVLGVNVGGPGGRDNAPPVAANDMVTTPVDEALVIDALKNDFDPEGGTLNIELVDAPANGTAAATNKGQIRYTPADGFQGTETFTYEISDEDDMRTTATITVVVGDPPDEIFLPFISN
ncbi:MAG: reprolysin-like metallopeptidase [Chloroflexota bacterium]